ncbi:MAG TPA: MarR family transcriptional regulator [Thermotogota bacterium]|nr:MarR family transcriptional regulator [Thermotogota bacterium]HPJ89481.1 MarR family transcriptional regulator [Thermotogota bacterium]HPR96372.1 MarR family transcriptional regulator [Thermotogota bacterium]
MKKTLEGLAGYCSILSTLINEFLREELKEASNGELYPSQCSVLYMVYKYDGRIQIKEIYDTLLKQKSTITEIINRLVKSGYVKKVRCDLDRRVTYIVATKKGMAFRKEFDKLSARLMNKMYKNFDEEEKVVLVQLILRAIENLS